MYAGALYDQKQLKLQTYDEFGVMPLPLITPGASGWLAMTFPQDRL